MTSFQNRADAVRRSLKAGNSELFEKQASSLFLDMGYEHPEFLQFFLDYSIHKGARDAIKLVEDIALEYRPKSAKQVYCLVDMLIRIGRISESLGILDGYIETHAYDKILSTLRNRIRRYREYGSRTVKCIDSKNHPSVSPGFSCDMIVIASNEGAYIADFIHHYFYLGFQHIFIGINSSSTDETLEICSLISRVYPNLHVISTDNIDFANNHYAEASYYHLWKYAATCSESAYCMIADVDEFLMFQGPKNIETFLAMYGTFDVLTIPWLEQIYQDVPFQSPLDLTNQLWRVHRKQQGKSVFRYASPFIDLTAHIPRFFNSNNPVRFIDAKSMSQREYELFDYGFIPITGIIGRPLTTSLPNPSSYNCAVLHYYSRSEVEYSARCLIPYGRKSKSFKHNRGGYATDKAGSSSIDQTADIFTSFDADEYYASLEKLKHCCGIKSLIDAATSRYSEEKLLNQIHDIPLNHVSDEETIWRRSFAGTRFLAVFEEILAAHEV